MRRWVVVLVAVACARGTIALHDDSQGSGKLDSAPPPDQFVAGPDADTCPMLPCSLAPQCGCPMAGSACDIDATTQMGTACRAVTAQGKEGATCATDTACAAGYVCVGDGTNDDCERYCAHDSDCISPRGKCVVQLDNGSGAAIAGATICSSNCDPTQATNALCPTGWSCDLFSSTFAGSNYNIVDCRKAGTAGQGAACSATVACGSAFTCVNNGTSTTCAKICPLPAGTGCPTGKTCLGFSPAFTVAGQQYGACG